MSKGQGAKILYSRNVLVSATIGAILLCMVFVFTGCSSSSTADAPEDDGSATECVVDESGTESSEPLAVASVTKWGEKTIYSEYDEKGRLQAEYTAYSPTSQGLVDCVVYSYDGDNVNPSSSSHYPNGAVTYDASTGQVSIEGVSDYSTTYTHDGDRLVAMKEVGGSAFYDVKTTEYDEKGNITSEVASKVVDGVEHSDSKVYENYYDDTNGLLSEVHFAETFNDGGGPRKISSTIMLYTYSDDGQLITKTSPDGKGYIAYKYDDAGNMIEETEYEHNGRVGATISYSYDEEGNLLSKISSDSGGVHDVYTYGYPSDMTTGWWISEWQAS